MKWNEAEQRAKGGILKLELLFVVKFVKYLYSGQHARCGFICRVQIHILYNFSMLPVARSA